MEWLTDPQTWIGLVTLVVLEVVLGIDNIVFISILVGKLPSGQQDKARLTGLGLAMGTRILLLLTISWIIGLTQPLFEVLGFDVSGRDLVLAGGGLFLVAKATQEIHQRLEGEEGRSSAKVAATFSSVILQIMLLDIVFSLDSVITAVGMVNQVPIMIAAVIIAVIFMMAASGAISDFIHRHPTIKMLALAFLLLIGVTLLVEALHQHIPRGYIYFAMTFSVFVELLNLRAARAEKPVELRQPYVAERETKGAKAS